MDRNAGSVRQESEVFLLAQEQHLPLVIRALDAGPERLVWCGRELTKHELALLLRFFHVPQLLAYGQLAAYLRFEILEVFLVNGSDDDTVHHLFWQAVLIFTPPREEMKLPVKRGQGYAHGRAIACLLADCEEVTEAALGS